MKRPRTKASFLSDSQNPSDIIRSALNFLIIAGGVGPYILAKILDHYQWAWTKPVAEWLAAILESRGVWFLIGFWSALWVTRLLPDSVIFLPNCQIRKIYDTFGPGRDKVWMTLFPDEVPSDSEIIIIILYGYKRLIGEESVSIEAVRESVENSAKQNMKLYCRDARPMVKAAVSPDGITNHLVREVIKDGIEEGFIERTQLSKPGEYYSLTTKGVARAKELVSELSRRA